VCVDDDLEYTGKDRLLSQAFAEAPKQQGWRILTLGSLHGNARVDLSEGWNLLSTSLASMSKTATE